MRFALKSGDSVEFCANQVRKSFIRFCIMKTPRVIWLMGLAVVCSVFVQSCGEDNPSATPVTGTIKGVISDAETGTPISGASITTLPPTQSVVSTSSGEYTIPDVAPGAYVVSVNKSGYNSRNVNVSVNVGKVTTSDVQLVTGPQNAPPTTPSNPTPQDGDVDQPTSVTLSWVSSEPDGDHITYDVFFGKTNPPTELVSGDLATATATRINLDTATTYFWQVLAKDSKGATALGPVWKFTTKSDPKVVSPQGLVAYYPFNGSGADASGHGNNGVVNAGVSSTTDRHGKQTSAFDFNGTSSGYISVGSSDDINFGPKENFTIAVWVKFSTTQKDFTGVVSKGVPDGANVGYQILITQGSKVLMDVTTTNGVFHSVVGKRSLNDGQWHLIVCTVASASRQVNVYVDGVLDAAELIPLPINCSLDNSSPLYIGKERNSKLFFRGAIDDVRLFDKVLTSAEIQELVNE